MTFKMMMHVPYPEMPTGYSNQAREWLPRIADRIGIENVAVNCTAGVVRFDTTWRGIRCYGRTPYTDMAEDLALVNYTDFGADVILTLCCPWKLHGFVWREMRTIHLMPVDRDPLGVPDYELLATGGGMPAAVSKFGERVLRDRGFEPLYLPHAVDTGRWRPPKDRRKLRQGMGLDHLFVAGVNGSNTDTDDRKRFWETLAGFAAFHKEYPRSVLLAHTGRVMPDGLNLGAACDMLGITDAVVFSDQAQIAGSGADEESLAAWYGALDVYLQLGNEGYGLPAAEAMACGTPVIAGTWGTGPELAGPTGWLADGQEGFHPGHQSRWWRPLIPSVADRLAEAYREAGERREAVRAFAAGHLDASAAWEEHWVPVIKELGG